VSAFRKGSRRPRRAAEAVSRARLRIDALATGGEGVGRLDDGRVAFVRDVAVGDLVEVEIDRSRRTPHGRVLEVIEPGPSRVTPPCPIAGACGGCDWMHISAEAQIAAHRTIVRDLLERIGPGLWPEVIAHPPPAPLRYRHRARLAIQARDRAVIAGYRSPRSNRVVDVEDCLVLAAPLRDLPEDLRRLLSGARGEGDAQVAVGIAQRPVVELTWRGELTPAAWAGIDERVARGVWGGARVWLEGASAPMAFGDPRPSSLGADGLPLALAPGGFSQPSEEGARALAVRVAELARVPGRHVCELFAGSGTLSVMLAGPAASFVAVERDRAAVACARDNFAARGLAGKITVADADAYRIASKTEVVVLDPPRAGALGAVREIARVRPKRVVYVSCDPATLARDLTVLLEAGYAPRAIETFELFPQTSHVETVVLMER
jgi:23S rRNA (uracil1939-C5)-methyltransferase